MIFEGALSVKAVINGGKRKVGKVLIDKEKKSRDVNYLKGLCQTKHIDLQFVTREEIDNLASGKTHGGIICEAYDRTFQELDDLISDNSFIFLLEGIEDPFNLGYMLRSLYSAGASGVLIADRDWEKQAMTITKSSAGASEFINICKSSDIPNDLKYLKRKNIKLLAAYRKDATSYVDVDYTEPCLIAIGGEMRGLSKDVLKMMDEYIYIPYGNDFRNALNASSAVSVIAYEILRQRSK